MHAVDTVHSACSGCSGHSGCSRHSEIVVYCSGDIVWCKNVKPVDMVDIVN